MAGLVVAGLGLAPDGGAWARESLLCQGWDWAGGGDTGGGRMEFCNFDSDTTSHSAQWGYAFTNHGVVGKIFFCQKIFDNFFSFQATEMVLTSKWGGRIQQEIQI